MIENNMNRCRTAIRCILYLVFSGKLNKKYQKISKMFAVKLFDGKHFLHYNKYCFGKEA